MDTNYNLVIDAIDAFSTSDEMASETLSFLYDYGPLGVASLQSDQVLAVDL